MEIAISDFKAKCIRLLKTTADSGEELVVTLRGKPLARVTGFESRHHRVLGAQAGAVDPATSDETLIVSDMADDWES